MRLLLCMWGERVQVTDAVAMAAIRCGGMCVKKMELLLTHRGTEISVTEAMVKAALRTSNLALMRLLHDKFGSQNLVTENVVMAAARGECSLEMTRLLLGLGRNHIQITEATILATLRVHDRWWAGTDDLKLALITLLLDSSEPQTPITKKVIIAAAGGKSSTEVMRLLLERGENQAPVTETAIVAATRGESPVRMLKAIMELRLDEMPITNGILEAASEIVGGIQIVKFLLDSIGEENLESQVDKGGIEEAKMMNNQGGDIRRLVPERIRGSHRMGSTRSGRVVTSRGGIAKRTVSSSSRGGHRTRET